MKQNKEKRLCSACRKNIVQCRLIKGKQYWRKECTRCSRIRRNKPLQNGNATIPRKKRGLKKLGKGTYICDQCGWLGYCDIHHKNENHYDNDVNNLVVLCPNCHRDEHYGKPT